MKKELVLNFLNQVFTPNTSKVNFFKPTLFSLSVNARDENGVKWIDIKKELQAITVATLLVFIDSRD